MAGNPTDGMGTSSTSDAGTNSAGTNSAGTDSLGAAGLSNDASNRLDQARQVATERLGQAREKATQLKATLADRLDAGASSLRERAQQNDAGAPQLAGATAGAAPAAGLLDREQVQRLAGPAADAMERTANFLRNGDMQASLEEQVKTNPGRTLLIALGVGYLLGKAIRR